MRGLRKSQNTQGQLKVNSAFQIFSQGSGGVCKNRKHEKGMLRTSLWKDPSALGLGMGKTGREWGDS